MSTLELKELSHPAGEVIKIAAGKTLDLKSQGTTTLPTGSVLQVVSATQDDTTAIVTTSSTYVTTGFNATITPSSTSSKIRIDASFMADAGTNGCNIYFHIQRGSTSLGGSQQDANSAIALVGNSRLLINMPFSYLDSPSTASAVTYELYMKVVGGTVRYKPDQCLSSLILTEIQG